MNTRTLRTLALVMVFLAGGLGLFAYRLSQQERRAAQPQADTVPFKGKVVIAIKPIEARKPIPADAVSLEPVTVMPEESFAQLDEVVGKEALMPVSVGEPVTERHFRPGSPLALALRPGERAVGVQVDGVVGAGGFVQPGDYVDVLLYLQDDKENQNTQARLLLRCLRVLSFGTKLRGERKEEKPTLDARNAVVAVSEEDTTKLMLAASAGRLRLALLPAAVCTGERTIVHPGPTTTPSFQPAALVNGTTIGEGIIKTKGIDALLHAGPVAEAASKSKRAKAGSTSGAKNPQEEPELVITLRQLAATSAAKAEPPQAIKRGRVAAARPPRPQASITIYRGTEKEKVEY